MIEIYLRVKKVNDVMAVGLARSLKEKLEKDLPLAEVTASCQITSDSLHSSHKKELE